MASLTVPHAGYNNTPLPIPCLDTAAIQVVTLSGAGDEQSVQLPRGYYYIVSAIDFDFMHGDAAIAAGHRLPWFASVYLDLYINEATTLLLTTSDAAGGNVMIVPARSA